MDQLSKSIVNMIKNQDEFDQATKRLDAAAKSREASAIIAAIKMLSNQVMFLMVVVKQLANERKGG